MAMGYVTVGLITCYLAIFIFHNEERLWVIHLIYDLLGRQHFVSGVESDFLNAEGRSKCGVSLERKRLY